MEKYQMQEVQQGLILREQEPPLVVLAGEMADARAREDVLARYRERRTAQTLRRQRADIALFERFLAEMGAPVGEMADDLSRWQHITFGLVEAFQRWELQQGYSIGSINVRLNTIRMYCTLAMQAGFLSVEARALIYTVRQLNATEGRNIDEKRVQRGIATRKEGSKKAEAVIVAPFLCRQLKDHLRTLETDLARRDLLLVCLLADMGLRCGEVAQLKANCCDMSRGTMTFYRHKVHKTQTHYLTDDTAKAARSYFERFQPTTFLFEGNARAEQAHPNGRITPAKRSEDGLDKASINLRIRVLGKLIGIPDLSPHDLRHSWATEHARKGVNVKALQQAGGWSSPAMPLHYVQESEIANEGLVERGR